MVSPLSAAQAYASIQRSAGLGSPTAASPAEVMDFASILKNTLGEAVSASRNAETQMQAQVQGQGNLVDVVTAISSAESSLETVIAVRDQVISAYQEIMRMTI